MFWGRGTLQFGLRLPHSQAPQGCGSEGGHYIILQTKVVFSITNMAPHDSLLHRDIKNVLYEGRKGQHTCLAEL